MFWRKKHEFLATTKEFMDSLREMFGQPLWSFRHEAIKNSYTKRMNEGTSIIEHVLAMMMHFNIAEVNRRSKVVYINISYLKIFCILLKKLRNLINIYLLYFITNL